MIVVCNAAFVRKGLTWLLPLRSLPVRGNWILSLWVLRMLGMLGMLGIVGKAVKNTKPPAAINGERLKDLVLGRFGGAAGLVVRSAELVIGPLHFERGALAHPPKDHT